MPVSITRKSAKTCLTSSGVAFVVMSISPMGNPITKSRTLPPIKNASKPFDLRISMAVFDSGLNLFAFVI